VELPDDTQALLNLCVRELANSLKSREKALSKCSKRIQRLVDKGIESVQDGNLDKAIACFYEVIENEPTYARVRLQLIDVHKHRGSHMMAVMHSGTALAYATEPRTICQIFCLAADAVKGAYEKHKDDQEADDAVQLYENAVDADPTDPVPRWNMVELLYKRNRADECKSALERLIVCVRNSSGRYRKYIDRVIADAETVLPQEEPWIDYIKRLRGANAIVPDRSDQSARLYHTRRAILAYSLGAAIAAVAVASGVEAAKPESTLPTQVKSQALEKGTPHSAWQRRVLDEADVKTEDSVRLTAVDYDPKDLKSFRGVDYDPVDLT